MGEPAVTAVRVPRRSADAVPPKLAEPTDEKFPKPMFAIVAPEYPEVPS